jgi:hypothetical protein
VSSVTPASTTTGPMEMIKMQGYVVLLASGLLAAGIGALIFTGLDRLTGFGTFSLAVPHVPAGSPR